MTLNLVYFELDDIYPYIYWTGNRNPVDDIHSARPDVKDCRVDVLKGLINEDYDWSTHVWKVVKRVETSTHEEEEEADVEMENEDGEETNSIHSGSTRGKKRAVDHGFEKQKHKLLFERSNPPQLTVNDDDLKKFLQSVIEAFVTALGEKLEQKFESRLDALECEIRQQLTNDINPAQGKTEAATSSEPPKVNTQPPKTDRSGIKAENLFDFNFSQSSDTKMNMKTQEYLSNVGKGLSQESNVTDFDTTPLSKAQKPIPWWTPSTSFQTSRVEIPKHTGSFGENWGTKRGIEVKLTDDPSDPDKFADSPLIFVSDKIWNQFSEWSMKPMIWIQLCSCGARANNFASLETRSCTFHDMYVLLATQHIILEI
ncbi:unnamed protein product [Eruca vesicaria subsp. sativa]|uniref:Uncharacterized protein n=1 Tax=Eruca vesicaria subsp. sativa TaxID=29727 RepID=A0ABC8LXZ8_ERUVS|nr:unnamed protein product [Eruca vesicaria subsp. sativa]